MLKFLIKTGNHRQPYQHNHWATEITPFYFENQPVIVLKTWVKFTIVNLVVYVIVELKRNSNLRFGLLLVKRKPLREHQFFSLVSKGLFRELDPVLLLNKQESNP